MCTDQAGSPSVTRYAQVNFPVVMRTNTYTASGSTSGGAATVYSKGFDGITFNRSAAASNLGVDLTSWTADAEL